MKNQYALPIIISAIWISAAIGSVVSKDTFPFLCALITTGIIWYNRDESEASDDDE